MRRLLTTSLVTLVAAAAIGAATAAADTTPAPTPAPVTTPAPPAGAPSTLYKKNVRMDISLQDTTGLVLDATLDQVADSAPARFKRYLEAVLDGELFSVDSTGATCFIDDGTATRPATCKQVADLVDSSVDAVPATVLARAIPGDPLDFVAKKVIAHSDGLTTRASAAAATGQQATIDVELSFAESGSLFDATLDDVDSSVPARLASVLESRLGVGTFTLDASRASCAIIESGRTVRAQCADVADLVNGAFDTVPATVLGRLVVDSTGAATFVATKVVADSDAVDATPQTSFGQGTFGRTSFGAAGQTTVPLTSLAGTGTQPSLSGRNGNGGDDDDSPGPGRGRHGRR
jgi:hypothetical protein